MNCSVAVTDGILYSPSVVCHSAHHFLLSMLACFSDTDRQNNRIKITAVIHMELFSFLFCFLNVFRHRDNKRLVLRLKNCLGHFFFFFHIDNWSIRELIKNKASYWHYYR